MPRLIIVESPIKAKTIQKFLGHEYHVLSSYGHIRDLPASELGVDSENNFQPKYVIPTKARKTVNLLKKAVLEADSVLLSTDPDREGEAIAWHLAQALGLGDFQTQNPNSSTGKLKSKTKKKILPKNGATIKKSYERITFHEITKEAIEEALNNPRGIDLNLVDAQQARRILDRIVGYKLSPFLWKKISRGLSAGRVQSVAVRLVVEREREIKAFIPQEYWSIGATFEAGKKIPVGVEGLEATLIKINENPLDKLTINNQAEADRLIGELKERKYQITDIETKQTAKNPLPPFTTSALQQEAWQRFKFPAKLTMQLAQTLYERGMITYHRTDSLNLSEQSLVGAKKFITETYGGNYWAGYFRKFKSKVHAQEAHEAIRPAYPDRIPDAASFIGHNGEKLARVYDMIWRRFIASQMAPAVVDSTIIDIGTIKSEENNSYTFRANGQMLKFDGFLKVYPLKFEEKTLPRLLQGDNLLLLQIIPAQHFTQPPARYNEATLIKMLEEKGIGRPSTYAPIISTIQERNYIEKDKDRRFIPTDTGMMVNDILVEHFPKIVDIGFTAQMEEELDEIADGRKEWVGVIRAFYQPFIINLESKYKDVEKKVTDVETKEICPKCGSPVVVRFGRFGKFLACSNFPKCKYTATLEKRGTGIKCPKCREGEITEKRTKTKKIFYGCSLWPKCDFALWDRPNGQVCEKCGSLMIETIKRVTACSNEECPLSIKRVKRVKKTESAQEV